MSNNSFLNRHRGKFLILIVLVIVIILIWAGYQAIWTGFDTKNLWNWMELLLVPAVLAGAVTLYNRALQKVERQRDLDRQRQETLTSYFDQMQELLLKHNLRKSKEKDEVRIVARARTVSALQNLDGKRITQLLRFLTEAGLGGDKLLTINLHQVDLKGENLSGTDLQVAILWEANLKGASLWKINLQGASLVGANLRDSYLREANLKGASLIQANLQRASLVQANLQVANLDNSNLKGANFWEAKMLVASLKFANLKGANLYQANLQAASLGGANLQKTDLEEANLQRTDLRGAKITLEQLDKVKTLEGATMPDGTKYEDWVAKGKPDWNKTKK